MAVQFRVLVSALTCVISTGCSQAPEPLASSVGELPADSTISQEIPSVETIPEEPVHTNRLINETSPYLLQHAHNPVNWYPWGEEALALAAAEDKPIFLSVGYSACHWCHVMERESFESEEIAAVLNEHFISIKVDREERPDIDEIYMTAVQAMTGSGGWPMSVFMTPDRKPFYGGTYFPPQDAYGRPGFMTVLTRLAELWNTKRGEIDTSAERFAGHIQQLLTGESMGAGTLAVDLVSNAARDLTAAFDLEEGGFGGAPKFPSSPSIAVLLREYLRTNDEDVLRAATHTLDKMAQGGMYDHLGGGFARYSTDSEWLVPHFEKMLYDNAQLAQVYLEAYQLTKNPFYRQVAEETFEYVLRDMRDERGGFYSAEDADSEGEEGKFYIWDYGEIVECLGEEDAKLFATYYAVLPSGNFASREHYHQGLNILHTPRSDADVAKELSLDVDTLQARISESNAKMLTLRSTRVRPGLDDKVLTSWNALMISALAEGYQIVGDERYRDAAIKAARFILDDMSRDGRLLRTHRKGESRLPAYLDDYAYMIVALADLYEATFDVQWLREADELMQVMIEDFWDTESPGFYFTSDAHKNLLVRTKTSQDSAVPSGNAMAAFGLLRLSKFLDKTEYYEKAKSLLEENQKILSEYPRAVLSMVCAADYMLHAPREIAFAGTEGDATLDSLLAAVRGAFLPNRVIAYIDPAGADAGGVAAVVPLLKGKTLVSGEAATYVCENFACQKPVTSPDELLKQLGVL